LPPTQQCCCGCSLQRGVQMIALYSIVVGALTLTSLLIDGTEDNPALTEADELVGMMAMIYQSLALFVGLKGVLGIAFRDMRSVRMLLLYYVVEVIVRSIAFAAREAWACTELRRLQLLREASDELTCETMRSELLVVYLLHIAVLLYFAYVIWSFVVRTESGEHGGGAEMESLLVPSSGADRPAASMFQPYAGVPHSLVEDRLPPSLARPGVPHSLVGVPCCLPESRRLAEENYGEAECKPL